MNLIVNKNINTLLLPALLFLYVLLAAISYGFIDPNLTLSTNLLVISYIKPLFFMVYQRRLITTVIYSVFLLFQFFIFYRIFVFSAKLFPKIQSLAKWLIPLVLILTLSFPMLSYDLFNYMTTAKLTYTYKENPYVVMPIEIPNDFNLAFTRAANKLALYGPPWILLTWIPHTLGMGNIWQTIIAFKFMNALWYIGFSYMLWRVTKDIHNVIFFALNPLVLIEILVSGHNDIVMMTLSCAGLLLWQRKALSGRIFGFIAVLLSIFIKGATVVFVPLLFFRKLTQERLMLIVSCLLFFAFVIAAPIREELYPWYAIWFLSTAAFLPYPKYSLLWQFLIVLSFGLELRHVPYMAMGYYEGPGPLLRTVFTVIPFLIWFVYVCWKEKLIHKVINLIRL